MNINKHVHNRNIVYTPVTREPTVFIVKNSGHIRLSSSIQYICIRCEESVLPCEEVRYKSVHLPGMSFSVFIQLFTFYID